MAMVRVSPLPVQVRCDWFDGRPRAVTLADATMPVVSVAKVRRETAAYPRATGPRTIVEVVTPTARLALSFRHRERRWVIEGIDPDAGGPDGRLRWGA
ncbi:MAG: hypothetical protein A2X23_08155 [Chloroflexi bacterium GWC2_73_18]|nr:MAG: hypothetical protein A2X23_08155 [Chloroflexi bacterium GWC2_73_18]